MKLRLLGDDLGDKVFCDLMTTAYLQLSKSTDRTPSVVVQKLVLEHTKPVPRVRNMMVDLLFTRNRDGLKAELPLYPHEMLEEMIVGMLDLLPSANDMIKTFHEKIAQYMEV